MSDVETRLAETIEELVLEVRDLKERVNSLESRFARQYHDQEFSSDQSDPVPTSDNSKPVVPLKRKPLFEVPDLTPRISLEEFIGGKLLNRVGALVLIVGIAYFLKYSFDNNWIGELGRIVLGFISGIFFMIAGHIFMRREYPYFSQGLTGTGIAIFYLSTFFAANYYHLISHNVAFALMFLAALTGGLLSVVQNAYGVALISTIGGFLTPFLAGNPEGNQIGLLGYIAILDTAVLFLAYFRKWKSLNLLAFCGTILISLLLDQLIVSQGVDLGHNAFIKQIFLTIYFIIFAGLPFLFSFRHKTVSESRDFLLAISNAILFFALSYWNLSNLHQENWMGYVSLLIGLFYLIFIVITKKLQMGDASFYRLSTSLSLAFSVIAVPLQLQGPWVKPAWLAGAIVLSYTGVKGDSIWIRWLGVLALTVTSLSLVLGYPTYSLVPILNQYCPALGLAAAGFFILFCLFRQEQVLNFERLFAWVFVISASCLLLYTSNNEIYNFVHYFYLSKSYIFIISLSWAFIAVGLIILGIKKGVNELRMVSLGIFAITTLRVVLYDLSYLETVFKIIILLAVGTILLGVSFLYQKRERGVE